jgi:hypothetical protein
MPDAPPPAPAPALSPLARALAIALAPVALLAALSPWLRVPALAALAVAYLAVTFAIVTGAGTAPHAVLAPFRRGGLAALSGIAAMVCGYALPHVAHHTVGSEVASGLIGTAGVLLLGTTVGAIVGTRIQQPGHLLAVALASSAADIWSVAAPEGVTRAIVEAPDPALIRLMAVSAAVPPSRVPEAVIGLGDVIFTALYAAASARHGLPRARTLAAVAAGILLAGVMVVVAKRPLPALPFIGAMVVLMQPRAREVPRRDRGATWVAAGIVVVAVARVMLLRRR